MEKWFEKFYTHGLLHSLTNAAGLVVYWLGVALCYKIGGWFSDAGSGFGLLLGLFWAGHGLADSYKAWVLGWSYQGSWNDPPPGRD